MQDVKSIYMKQRKSLFFLLSFYVLGWGFTSYKTIFLGLVLGTACSLFNLWLLAKRMDKFEAALMSGRNVRSLGMFSRMATAVVAVMLALEYPEHLHFYSVIVGLMTSYIVIMIDFLMQALTNKKQ